MSYRERPNEEPEKQFIPPGAEHFDLRGGRMSVSGIVATVFGCTGFLGHYVVNELGRHGSQVVVPYRGEEGSINALKVMGDLGQIIPTTWDIRDKDTIRRACQHSNVVINLTHRKWDTRNFKMSQVHVEGAKRIAEVAKEMGIRHLIHVSALQPEGGPQSDWQKTKFDGELAVKSVFPDACIIRPSLLWGPQDDFLRHHAQLMKYWWVYPMVHGDKHIQPVYVDNVAQAIVRSLIAKDSSKGVTYEIAGPDITTTRQFAEWVRKILKMPNKHFLDISQEDLWHLGYWLGQHRHPRWTLDNIKENNNTLLSGNYPGLAELGVKPYRVNSEYATAILHPFRHPTRQLDLTEMLEEIPDLQVVPGPGKMFAPHVEILV
jgi:NADH dehydrogenase (ubiquinone) 1 alpha subcomplex subunit 9